MSLSARLAERIRPARGKVGLVVGGLALSLALIVRHRYTARAPWFAVHGSDGLLLACALVMALAAAAAVAGFAQAQGRRSWLWLGPLAVLGLALATSGVAWLVPHPSVERVEAALASGDLHDAELELSGLVVVAPADPETAKLRERVETLAAEREDEERAAKVREAGLNAAARVLAGEWHDAELQARMTAEFRARAAGELEALWTARGVGLGAVAQAVAPYDPKLAARARGLSQLVSGHRCLERGDLDCARERLATSTEEITAEHAAYREALLAALAAEVERLAARKAKGRPEQELLGELDRVLELAAAHEEISGAPIEGVELGEMQARRDRVAHELAAKQRAAEREAKRAARRAKARERAKAPAKKKTTKTSSGSGWGGGVTSSGTCCKVCRSGKACGDSCISRSKACHRGPGCACDG